MSIEDAELAEILAVENAYLLLSWPVGAPPNAATRKWVRRRSSEEHPERVGWIIYRPRYFQGVE